jgi:hypothetical protein
MLRLNRRLNLKFVPESNFKTFESVCLIFRSKLKDSSFALLTLILAQPTLLAGADATVCAISTFNVFTHL